MPKIELFSKFCRVHQVKSKFPIDSFVAPFKLRLMRPTLRLISSGIAEHFCFSREGPHAKTRKITFFKNLPKSEGGWTLNLNTCALAMLVWYEFHPYI